LSQLVLRKELLYENVSASFAETIKGVTDSTAVTIDIEDDLLMYENMDEGTFKMEKEDEPLGQAFGFNINAMKLLAKSRSVNLSSQGVDA